MMAAADARGETCAGGTIPCPAPRPAIFPAVDLRGGRCVRLVRGARGAEMDYGGDPTAAARRGAGEGAEWIHAIDLGGALGEADNLSAITAIARAVAVPVQAGGGLRDGERVDRLLSGGVSRVILGTRALAEPAFLQEMIGRYGPSRIVLAMDVSGEMVKVRGWEGESGMDLSAGLNYARDAGVAQVLLTAIDRDGTLEGPRLELLARVLKEGNVSVVAAGGIGSLEDVRSVLALRHPRLEGVVVGRALYEGKVDLRAAVQISKEYRK